MGDKFKSRKSWRQKLENPPKGLPKVVNGPAKWEKRFGGRWLVVLEASQCEMIRTRLKAFGLPRVTGKRV